MFKQADIEIIYSEPETFDDDCLYCIKCGINRYGRQQYFSIYTDTRESDITIVPYYASPYFVQRTLRWIKKNDKTIVSKKASSRDNIFNINIEKKS